MDNKDTIREKNFRDFFKANTAEISIFILLVILIIIGCIISPYFLEKNNLSAISVKFSYYGIAASGCMMVMILGGIDISQMCILGVTVMLCGTLDNKGVSAGLIIVLVLLYGICAGLINGILVGKLKVLPMIATIGMSFAWRAVAYLISPTPKSIGNNLFKIIGYNKFLGISIIMWIFIVVVLIRVC